MSNESVYYSLREFAKIIGKSPNLLHRRLTEKPKRYEISCAIKVGGEWRFSRSLVDQAVETNEPLYVKLNGNIPLDDEKLRRLLYK